MQRLEVSGAVRPIYGSLGVKRLIEHFMAHVMKTNLMHYLSLVYFASQPLHVSGIFVALHQEVCCIYTAIGTCCAF